MSFAIGKQLSKRWKGDDEEGYSGCRRTLWKDIRNLVERGTKKVHSNQGFKGVGGCLILTIAEEV